ncbi:aminoglycoside phosphotransferase APH(3') [Paenibacillus baekrokdamisoli]|uniref:Aminoglycoside phosphotransferase APH(3') n=1 Tax=Paenibacillus baekrokdamisoli TaxID=1712516 RepID=A0A3G9JG38_9BACL|nr:aminoglycoside 3'-phosphotransferase [Paenibacillus baekrokdamisoli]MBB3071549.1 kanamycin kinase [Paenibacillus baekrokdamisoli]BBH21939.1 aminoglycoside phosphotransferase APH(3') [Paenibacillus baekrokdamisoli]
MNPNVEPVIYDSFPSEIQSYLKDSNISIIKNKIRSSVYHLENQTCDSFLKVTPKGQLKSEAMMTDYLSKYGVCPKVLIYTSDDAQDYLITDRVIGLDAASAEYLVRPERLTEVFAESLSSLHQIKALDCPSINGLEEMVIRAERNYRAGKVEKGLLRYVGYKSVDVAYKDMLSLYKSVKCEDKVIIHGDYCLPNLILHDFNKSGYIDVGYAGIGDRHYDIFWGLWSLQYNLKSDNYTPRFIEVYGRHRVDQDRLHLCGLLSVFNGFRGQDYYE